MNADEFRVWLNYHGDAFPGVSNWMVEKASPCTRGHWERVLVNASLEHAKRATDGMLAGEYSQPPGYSNLPGAIASICNRLANAERPVYCDDRQTRCPECDNYGTVLVWHDAQVEAMKTGEFPARGKAKSMAVACTCNCGDRMATRTQNWTPLPRFNEAHYLRVSGNYPTDEEIAELEEFALDASRHPNFHEEFSVYS